MKLIWGKLEITSISNNAHAPARQTLSRIWDDKIRILIFLTVQYNILFSWRNRSNTTVTLLKVLHMDIQSNEEIIQKKYKEGTREMSWKNGWREDMKKRHFK